MSNNAGNATETRREDWETPQWLFDTLSSVFNITVDLAATKKSTKATWYVTPELDFLTNGISAIKEAYPNYKRSAMCWCNPPYYKGGNKAWVNQLLLVPNLLTLLPASLGSKWFLPCWGKATAVVIFPYRLKFEGAPCGAQFDSCLVIRATRITKKQLNVLQKLGTVITQNGVAPYIGSR